MKKIIRKNRVLIIIIIILMIFETIFLFSFADHKQFFVDLYNNHDFHCILVIPSLIISVFCFLSTIIFVGLALNPSIKRLWDNGYLDGMYHSGIAGIFVSCMVFAIRTVFVLDLFDIDRYFCLFKVLITSEITLFIGNLMLFLYCVFELIFCAEAIRKGNQHK